MATQSFSRTLRPSLPLANGSDHVCLSCRRQNSSFRRTRKALRVNPDESFLPSKTESSDHIIFNPPSSAPSVYHTPSKFLPKNDPRRKLHLYTRLSTSNVAPAASALKANPASESSSSKVPSLPSAVRPEYQKKYHLTQEQIDEIKRLRAEDPRQWTRVRLAEKFQCSQFFVSLCCCAPQIKAERERDLEEIKKRWGRRKTEAREDRQIRKAQWGSEI
ncbi:hypothetical protein K431DRAFT_287371 [Polychaeton citri CBS 116435]|uniref:60S ribosomal protein L20 n=1 Tax=Polychaeton citri CBS 116435 TaxID=1314669 RepID=A0A9P4UME6_9PEZI|nr:hypothetical protein K431DRAFT_287371 [Polychaeton citri CBS 116435]